MPGGKPGIFVFNPIPTPSPFSRGSEYKEGSKERISQELVQVGEYFFGLIPSQ